MRTALAERVCSVVTHGRHTSSELPLVVLIVVGESLGKGKESVDNLSIPSTWVFRLEELGDDRSRESEAVVSVLIAQNIGDVSDHV
jgi:hypothetical protein